MRNYDREPGASPQLQLPTSAERLKGTRFDQAEDRGQSFALTPVVSFAAARKQENSEMTRSNQASGAYIPFAR